MIKIKVQNTNIDICVYKLDQLNVSLFVEILRPFWFLESQYMHIIILSSSHDAEICTP